MAQWVGMEAKKSCTERMSVRDHPTLDWFETTDVSDSIQRVKEAWKRRVNYFILKPLHVYPLSHKKG